MFFVHEKSCPFTYSDLAYNNEQDLLDIQYCAYAVWNSYVSEVQVQGYCTRLLISEGSSECLAHVWRKLSHIWRKKIKCKTNASMTGEIASFTQQVRIVIWSTIWYVYHIYHGNCCALVGRLCIYKKFINFMLYNLI